MGKYALREFVDHIHLQKHSGLKRKNSGGEFSFSEGKGPG